MMAAAEATRKMVPGVEAVGVTGVGAGDDEGGLAGDGYAEAFGADEQEDSPIAVGVDEVAYVHDRSGTHRPVRGRTSPAHATRARARAPSPAVRLTRPKAPTSTGPPASPSSRPTSA